MTVILAREFYVRVYNLEQVVKLSCASGEMLDCVNGRDALYVWGDIAIDPSLNEAVLLTLWSGYCSRKYKKHHLLCREVRSWSSFLRSSSSPRGHHLLLPRVHVPAPVCPTGNRLLRALRKV